MLKRYSSDYISILNSGEPPVLEEWTTKPLKLAERSDVLICVVGATSGKINFGTDCAIGRSVAAIRPVVPKLDQNYLYYFLSTWTQRLRSGSQGSAQGVITKRMLESLQIPLPPIAEQRRIAAILDKADGIRRDRKQAIQYTEELLRSAFLDMFGDPVTNPKGWEMVTVDDVVSAVRDGPHVSPKYSDQGIPILSTRNIRPSRLVLNDMKYVSVETYQELTAKFKPQRGDVLLTKGGTTGYAKSVDWTWPFAIWVHLAALRPIQSKILPEVLESTLNSPNCYVQSQRYTHGIANHDLGLSRIRKIEMFLPPMKLQKQFCNFRKSLLDTLRKQETNTSESNNLFDSLLQRAFKGDL